MPLILQLHVLVSILCNLSPSVAVDGFMALTEAEFSNFSSKPICLSSLPVLVTDTIHSFSPLSEISRNHAIVIFLLKTTVEIKSIICST